MTTKRMLERPTVALVGRTNVGKSTLWNRLTETGRALVSAEPHTTRDRNYGTVIWRGSAFDIVDTGGMDVETTEIGHGIQTQSERALASADLVLFITDAKTGVLPQDHELAKRALKLNKRIWLVANKTDKGSDVALSQERDFYRLGLGEPRPVSAATGLGVGDLLDEIMTELDRVGHPATDIAKESPLRIVIVGRPNVGKSSLMNAIVGEDRVIVSPIPHTTREPQDTWLRYKEKEIVLVDTAGMRKRAHVASRLEEEGIERNERTIENGDVALLVFDVTVDPTTQDRHLAGLLEDANKGVILVANKWDLVGQKDTDTSVVYERLIRQLFPFLSWAPLMFVSAKNKQRVTKLLDMALQIQEERYRHIDYNALNRLLKVCIKASKPLASYGPKSPRIYDVAQVGHAPPTFLVTIIGEKEGIHPNWLRFFEKRLREKFGFTGTPIVVKARNVMAAKMRRKRNTRGPGMEAVAGIIEDRRTVNLTRRRQKK